MATSLGGWFDKVFFNAHGEPCASGELRFYQTGTDIPQGVATFDGTPLGAVVRLDDDGRPESDFRFYTDKIYRVVVVDADGVVVKQIDGVAIPEGEGGGGMSNPMTDPGDLIFGGPAGAPLRRGIGDDGDILAVAPNGGGLSPTWEAGPKKYRNVYHNVRSPSIDEGYLGGLYYLSEYAQTLELPPATNIPAKSFIDFVFLDNAATLTITPQGGSVLNAQGSAITIGGQAATLYRLTFLGRGDIGGVPTDQWALGGSVSSGGGGGGGSAVQYYEPFGHILPGNYVFHLGSANNRFCCFGRTAIRNCKIKSIHIGTGGLILSPYAEAGVYEMRSPRALTLISKVSTWTAESDNATMRFDFSPSVSVGDEIVFIGLLSGPTNVNDFATMNCTTTAAIFPPMSTYAFADATKYPVSNSPWSVGYGIENQNYRLGFYLSGQTTLPASTTISQWSVSGSVLVLPYCVIATE